MLKYWCFEREAEPAGPWYQRNNCCKIIGGSLLVLAVLGLVAFFIFGPPTYAFGLLAQVVLQFKEINYEYLFAAVLGALALIALIIVLTVLVLFVVIIIQCFSSCRDCCRECKINCHDEYQASRRKSAYGTIITDSETVMV